jgi:N-methylhydantoinase B/acetone carboxylase alpha subunit
MSSRLAAAVCGAEIREDGDGAAHVDAVATADRRDELRRDRARRATPVREWMQQEREARVVPRDVIEPVARMYRSAMELSPEWAGEYREFWDLPKDFVY